MQLDETQWHVRWFRWNQRVLDRFAHRDEDHSYDRTYKGTDLCTYMRTIMLGTGVAVLSLGWWAALVGFVLLPFYLFGMMSPVLAVLGAAAGIAGFGLIVWGIITLVPKTVGIIHDALTPEPGKPTGFAACCWQWVVATKHRFCPIIKFDQENDNDQPW